jgi:hypothetical protein
MNEALRLIRLWLGNASSVTSAEIEQRIDELLILPRYKTIDRQQLFREITFLYAVRNEDFRIISDEERRLPWLDNRRASICWSFWNRYRSYLEDHKGFAPVTITKLDRLTDRIIDGLFDPTANIAVSKKGLCVGQVQSGKTANYTGLICKAADAGFKFIIILAGIHNNLRSQTQLRLDEGFLGFDTQFKRAFDSDNIRIGVGIGSNSNTNSYVAHSLTSSLENGDFSLPAANTSAINFDTKEPIIAVVKKHPKVLNRLHQWLSSKVTPGPDGKRVIDSKSLLLIDDEADNASINISNDPVRTSAINNGITQIIALFRRSGYIGYTATPFANIFIPIGDDNLFPRDFIINIPPPSTYIGPELVFGYQLVEDHSKFENVLPIVNRIQDYASFVPDKHKKDDALPAAIPTSLCLAIRCFIITCAIRRLRGQTLVHNSMLVHVSRFQRWQARIKELVEHQFDFYRRAIDQNDPETIELFRQTFEDEAQGYRSYKTISSSIMASNLHEVDAHFAVHNWKDVFAHLNDAASRITVREIHGSSKDALDYYDHKDGLSLIAIGGNKLSRGLTLEGLSVSYYLRASRMYDTLMQMGRWFGYRPGYVDLCRLFTSRELNEWFCHIAVASEELKEEFDHMYYVAGTTPEKYALKVRTLPGVLQISAANKIRTATPILVSWSGLLVESYALRKDMQSIAQNFNALSTFVSNLPSNYEIKGGNYLWHDITPGVIVSFFNNITGLDTVRRSDPRNLVKFIETQLPSGELSSWRVALMTKRDSANSVELNIAGKPLNIGSLIRTQDKNMSDETVYYLTKSHIISPDHEFIDLTEEEYTKAMDLTKEKRTKSGEPQYPNGKIVREYLRQPQHPLLLLYLLDPLESKTGLPKGTPPFIGYAISFPQSKFDNRVSYVVHEQLLSQFDFQDDDMEDFEDEN